MGLLGESHATLDLLHSATRCAGSEASRILASGYRRCSRAAPAPDAGEGSGAGRGRGGAKERRVSFA